MFSERRVRGIPLAIFAGVLACESGCTTSASEGAVNEENPVTDVTLTPSQLTGTGLGALSVSDVPPVVEQESGLDLVPHFIKNEDAAILLGKALFYDMSAGSDGQACGSCHFHSGADSRLKNQLNPGGTAFDSTGSGGAGGPNYTAVANDFPFHKLADPDDRNSKVLFDSDDRFTSQGVFASFFVDIMLGTSGEVCDRDPVDSAAGDPQGFHINGLNVRRVEPRNTPSIINAVFNFRNFWDCRANNVFNGEDPFGRRNEQARILVARPDGTVALQKVAFANSSLASQAVGPLGSSFEMACAGRTAPAAGKKLVHLKPLVSQLVDTSDSVLGSFSCQDVSQGCSQPQGLSTTYQELIEAAFADRLWDSPRMFDAEKTETSTGQYTMLEANFALFWGLSIQAYESTLISNQTRFDDFAANSTPLTEAEMRGLDLFVNDGKCVACHDTAMFSKSSTQHLLGEQQEEGLVERMLMGQEKHLYALRGGGNVQLGTGTGFNISVDAAGSPTAVGQAATGADVSGTLKLVFRGPPATPCEYQVISYMLGADSDPETRDVLLGGALAKGKSKCPSQVSLTVIDHWDSDGPGGIKDHLVLDAGAVHFEGAFSGGSFDNLGPALYDNGHYNIGVRPTAEDIGLGGVDPFGNPLSFARQYLSQLQGMDVPDRFEIDECTFDIRFDPSIDIFDFPGGFDPVACDDGTTAYRPTNNAANQQAIQHARVAVDGAFKVPSLRNIELIGPNFHNGGQANLDQVMAFYNRGGDFAVANRLDTDPDIQPLFLSADQRADLVAFMKTLTDERVRCKMAPFDHPQLFVPNGHPGDEVAVTEDLPNNYGRANDEFLEISAVGASGVSPENCLTEFAP